jgi:CBS domain containing-hemolysin-like protein
MILVPLALLAAGVCLGAFFNGCETGFYRANHTRMVLDAKEGKRTSARLLFYLNHPPLFVATALVGNNIASYMVSFSLVLLSQTMLGPHPAAEMASSLVATPLLFIYGELLPKHLFHQAPNRLLGVFGPAFMFFSLLFSPVLAVLWLVWRLQQQVAGQSQLPVRQLVARQDLGELLREGHEAGLLHPTQLELSRSFFEVATEPVVQWSGKLDRQLFVPPSTTRDEAIRVARSRRLRRLIVSGGGSGMPAGYVNATDLAASSAKTIQGLVQPLFEVAEDTVHAEAILMMQTNRVELVAVVDRHGRMRGFLTREALLAPLLGGSLDVLSWQQAGA